MLLSRSGGSGDDARKFVDEFPDVKIATPQCDISDEQALATTLEEYAAKMPPIQGCIQASMVLAVWTVFGYSLRKQKRLTMPQNSFFEKMPFEAFIAAVKPKVAGSWNLHKLLPNDLDFFILLSSASGVTGFRSQANYAAGNTYQDSLARHRIMNGQNAVSLDLGMIENIGYVAERPKIRESAKRNGFLPIIDSELLALLDYYCDPNLGILSPSKCQVITGLEIPTSMSAQGLEHSYWMGRNQFRALHQINNNNSSTDSINKVNDLDVTALLSATQSMDEAALIVINSLVKKLSRTMSMPEENIDPTKPMHTFGADSLVALEIRNWFAKEMEVDVTVFEILGNESITELGLEVAGRSRHCRRFLDTEKAN